MPDNLRITTPVNNAGGIARPNQTGEPNRTAPVNPSRVPGSGKDTEAGWHSADLLLSGSVFSDFIRQLQRTPGLDQTLQKVLEDAAARMFSAAGAAGHSIPVGDMPAPLQSLVSALAADADGLVKEAAAQREDATLFTGPLFRLLGQISAQTGDPQFDLRLADLLKAYSGFSNAAGTMQAIRGNLEELKNSIPRPFAVKVAAMMEKLSREGGASSLDADLAVLKRGIIPLLGEYAAQTNETGKPRDMISMLLHNTAILDESSGANLTAKFEQLFAYCRDTLGLPEMTLSMMRSFFSQELSAANERKETFPEKLAPLLSGEGSTRPAGGPDRAVLGDISRALLFDSSVFMPFQHLILPAEIGGRFLFAQMWVEKTDPDETRREFSGEEPAPKTVYLSFEVEDLGSFEAAVSVTGKKVSMKLSCPPPLRNFYGEIRDGISAILKKNGLAPGEVRLSSAQGKPQIPMILLEKIQERRRSVDVSV